MSFALPKLSLNDVEDLQDPMELDLIAFYKLLQSDVMKILDRDDLSPDEMINKIEELLNGPEI